MFLLLLMYIGSYACDMLQILYVAVKSYPFEKGKVSFICAFKSHLLYVHISIPKMIFSLSFTMVKIVDTSFTMKWWNPGSRYWTWSLSKQNRSISSDPKANYGRGSRSVIFFVTSNNITVFSHVTIIKYYYYYYHSLLCV